MTEASGGGEEPNGCFEGWEGVLLAWRVKGRRREQGPGGKEEPVVDMGLLQGQWEPWSVPVILQCSVPL